MKAVKTALGFSLVCLGAACLANASSRDADERTAVMRAPGSTSMTAELVRRVDGGWVISKLRSTTTPMTGGAPLADQPALEKTIDRYRVAMTRGDMNALSSVWLMNPAERAEVGRVAASPRRPSIAISEGTQKIAGHRAWVQFVQEQVAAAAPESRRTLSRRRLSAHDRVGGWAGLKSH